jgi:hypothetical protein
MPFLPLTCAVGHGADLTLPAAATVAIAPNDNSVDANRITITGSGTISSFGVVGKEIAFNPADSVGQIYVTKQLTFAPASGQTITLHHNPPALTLMGGVDRVISAKSIGSYTSDINGNWVEEGFQNAAAPPAGGVVSVNTYTASAPITILGTRAYVRMWGGSGAAGAGTPSNAYAVPGGSAGVGAPGYLEKFLIGLTPGNTLAYTQGAAGAATTGTGGNGGASILASGTQTIATLTANGSNGSSGAAGVQGSTGGTATGGDVNRTGQTGGMGPPVYQFSSGPQTVDLVGSHLGIGGRNELANGVDGTYASPGNPGNAGGLIITWLA